MAYNKKVTEQVQKMAAAYIAHGPHSAEYEKEERTYFATLETEARKGGADAWAWLAMEDPTDALIDSIVGGDAEWTADVLGRYRKFWKVIERVFPDRVGEKQREVENMAKAFIELA